MELTPLTRKIIHIDLKATLATGQAVTITTPAQVALVPHRADVKASTVWTNVENWDATALTGTALLAGYEADASGAIVVPSAGADLYARIKDTPEDDPAFIERIVYG